MRYKKFITFKYSLLEEAVFLFVITEISMSRQTRYIRKLIQKKKEKQCKVFACISFTKKCIRI